MGHPHVLYLEQRVWPRVGVVVFMVHILYAGRVPFKRGTNPSYVAAPC